MSLVSFIGPKPNLLGIDERNPPLRLEVSQPVLDFYEMEKIRHIERYTDGKFSRASSTSPTRWRGARRRSKRASRGSARRPRTRCARAIDHRHLRSPGRPARRRDPALLALSAIHQHLVGKGLRTSTGLVVETG